MNSRSAAASAIALWLAATPGCSCRDKALPAPLPMDTHRVAELRAELESGKKGDMPGIQLGLELFAANRFREAIGEWMRIPAFSPRYAAAQNNAGAAYIRLGDLKSARRAIEEALRREPDSALFRKNKQKLEEEEAKRRWW